MGYLPVLMCANNRYPGGPLLNPLGLAKDISGAHDWKLKEIKNGSYNSSLLISFE